MVQQTGCTQAGGPGCGFLANGGIKPNSTVGTPSLADLRAGTGGYVPNQTRPKAIQWNFGIQHVFAHNYTLDSEYIGTHGIDLPMQIQLNRQPTVNASNALPLFYSMPSQAALNSLTNTLSGLHDGVCQRRQHRSGVRQRRLHGHHHLVPALGQLDLSRVGEYFNSAFLERVAIYWRLYVEP